jgi:DNA-directed RNA polymerase specialized sigma24 family protein
VRADKYLGQVRRLDARINAKIAERQRVMELATRITPTLTDDPGGAGGVSDKIGNAVARLVVLEQEINEAIDQLIDTRAEVLELLESLPVDEYTVLHGHYILGRTFAAIAETMKPRPLTERQVHRIKGRGRRRVQSILDEREADYKTTN